MFACIKNHKRRKRHSEGCFTEDQAPTEQVKNEVVDPPPEDQMRNGAVDLENRLRDGVADHGIAGAFLEVEILGMVGEGVVL